MEQFVTRAIEAFIFPPGIFLIVFAVAAVLLDKRPLLARRLLYTGIAVFYLVSTQLVADLLISQVEIYPALEEGDFKQSGAGAIVILGSGRDKDAREFGGDTVGRHSLLRARYGAFLQRKTGLPIVVSGGLVLNEEGKSIAQVMADLLEEEFKAGEVWLEDQSRTTGENALFSKRLLAKRQIDTVYLVTQAWHMPRSVRIFEKAGFNVVPAPTAFESGKPLIWLDVLPSAGAIKLSRMALHEMAGAVWYRIRY
jgi:uncharacterized SAM-binding protein YcdF (DUF218 family)